MYPQIDKHFRCINIYSSKAIVSLWVHPFNHRYSSMCVWLSRTTTDNISFVRRTWVWLPWYCNNNNNNISWIGKQLDPSLKSAIAFYSENSMSVEVVTENGLQRIRFRVRDQVRWHFSILVSIYIRIIMFLPDHYYNGCLLCTFVCYIAHWVLGINWNPKNSSRPDSQRKCHIVCKQHNCMNL